MTTIAYNAYHANLNDFNYVAPRKSMVNYKYCMKYGLTKQQVVSKFANQRKTEIKEEKKKVFFELYNEDLTIKENIEYFEEKTGIKVSERTVKRWKKERSDNNIIGNGTYTYPTFEDTENGMVSEDFFVNYLLEKDFDYEYTKRT